MASDFDAIVVGGGHNGLVAAFYLARGGLKTLVLERRHVVGGAAVTEEFHPGYRNSIAAYVVSLLRPEVVADLELKRHGYETIPITGSFAPFADGRYLLLTGEEAHDRAEVGKFSNRDYDAMTRFRDLLHRLADAIRAQMLREPPRLSGAGMGDLVSMLRLGLDLRRLDGDARHRLVQLFAASIGDILDRRFDSEAVKLLYAATATAGNMVSLYQPGSAINLLHLTIGEVDGVRGGWALAKGGMGAITQGMAAAARERGVEIRTKAPVARVLVRDGGARGVRLEDGTEIAARVVLANTDPKRTFLALVGEEYLEPDFAADIRAYRMESGSLRMNLALSGVPEFAALPGPSIGRHHKSFIRLMPSWAEVEEAYHAARQGDMPRRPIIDAVIPSALDDGLAPPGCHVMGLLCQHYPYRLSGGRDWDEVKERVADRIIDELARHVPNIRRILVGRQVLSPLDLERVFGLTGGDVYHGRLDLDQLFSLRPHPKAAQYRTPIRGLYLCGSGAHPGGGVSGAPGHNAARRVLKDLRR